LVFHEKNRYLLLIEHEPLSSSSLYYSHFAAKYNTIPGKH